MATAEELAYITKMSADADAARANLDIARAAYYANPDGTSSNKYGQSNTYAAYMSAQQAVRDAEEYYRVGRANILGLVLSSDNAGGTGALGVSKEHGDNPIPLSANAAPGDIPSWQGSSKTVSTTTSPPSYTDLKYGEGVKNPITGVTVYENLKTSPDYVPFSSPVAQGISAQLIREGANISEKQAANLNYAFDTVKSFNDSFRESSLPAPYGMNVTSLTKVGSVETKNGEIVRNEPPPMMFENAMFKSIREGVYDPWMAGEKQKETNIISSPQYKFYQDLISTPFKMLPGQKEAVSLTAAAMFVPTALNDYGSSIQTNLVAPKIEGAYDFMKIIPTSPFLPIREIGNASIASIEMISATPSFILSLPYGAAWALTRPAEVPRKAVGIGIDMGTAIYERELESPGSSIGTAIGMVAVSKGMNAVVSEFPIKRGEFRIPIETPEGMPKTREITLPARDILTETEVGGIKTILKSDITPDMFKTSVKSEPIQYYSTYKGLYLDTSIVDLLQGKGKTYYARTTPLVGAAFEPGGKLMSGLSDSSIVKSVIEKAREIPVAKEMVGFVESRSTVRTGLWTGSESLRNYGRVLEPRISGAIDFLNVERPKIALQKLEAIESLLPKEDIDYVKAIIKVRDITSSGKVVLSQVEPFGEHTPATLKPKTYELIKDYFNANPEDIRLYGSLVGRTYLGSAGRSTLGDVDALMRSGKSQMIADDLWNLYLEGEYGKGTFNIETSSKTFVGADMKPYTDILRVATDKTTGKYLSKLETGASQITGKRIMGLTKTGEHALDLHPISELKYTTELKGTAVKSITPGELIWGKQTIGNPPIGTISIDRLGKSTAVVDIGGRVKDVYDTRSFAAKTAEVAYLKPETFKYGIELENAFDIIDKRLRGVDQAQQIGGYPKGITLKTFMDEFVNPLDTAAVKNAKLQQLNKPTKMYSGFPIDETTYRNTLGYLSDLSLKDMERIPYGIGVGAGSKQSYSPIKNTYGYTNKINAYPLSYTPKISTSYTPKISTSYTPKISTSYTPKISTSYTPKITSPYNPSIASPYTPKIPSPYTPTPYTPSPYTPTPYTPTPYTPKTPTPYTPKTPTPYTPKTPTPYTPNVTTPQTPLFSHMGGGGEKPIIPVLWFPPRKKNEDENKNLRKLKKKQAFREIIPIERGLFPNIKTQDFERRYTILKGTRQVVGGLVPPEFERKYLPGTQNYRATRGKGWIEAQPVFEVPRAPPTSRPQQTYQRERVPEPVLGTLRNLFTVYKGTGGKISARPTYTPPVKLRPVGRKSKKKGWLL